VNGPRRLINGVVVAAPLGFGCLGILVAERWSPLMSADRAIASCTYRLSTGHPAWVPSLRVGTQLLGPLTWLLVTGALACWLARQRRMRAAAAAVALILAADLIEFSGKLLVPRDRPSRMYPVIGAGTSEGGSFPSGHSLSAPVGCGIVLWVTAPYLSGWRRWAVAGTAATVVLVAGCSRILLDVHWTSDVIGGWLAGTGVLAIPGRRLLPTTRTSPRASSSDCS
jgi:membrane-associated phospholipid phosphatase